MSHGVEQAQLVVDSDAGVLMLTGEVDVAVCHELLRHLTDPHVHTVDLSGVTFLDASALSSFAYAHQLRPGEIVLRRPTPRLRWLLRLSGLDRVIDVDLS